MRLARSRDWLAKDSDAEGLLCLRPCEHLGQRLRYNIQASQQMVAKDSVGLDAGLALAFKD